MGSAAYRVLASGSSGSPLPGSEPIFPGREQGIIMFQAHAMTDQRQDTKLESEGAEFLVLGNLLVEGISCFKAYVNFPGCDLVAVNSENSRTARIQVKSRWATNYDRSFPIKNFECEFVVHVALNRGYRFGKRPKEGDTGVKDPVFSVFPVSVVKAAQNAGDKWGKVTITNIPDHERDCNGWSLVTSYLRGSTAPAMNADRRD